MLPLVLPASQPGLRTWPPQKLRWKQPEEVEFHFHVIVPSSVTFAAATSSVSSKYSAGTWLAWTSLFTGARAACSPAWKILSKVWRCPSSQTVANHLKRTKVWLCPTLRTVANYLNNTIKARSSTVRAQMLDWMEWMEWVIPLRLLRLLEHLWCKKTAL